MLGIVRKFRRWKHGKRCSDCNRKFMFKHKCKASHAEGICGCGKCLWLESEKKGDLHG